MNLPGLSEQWSWLEEDDVDDAAVKVEAAADDTLEDALEDASDDTSNDTSDDDSTSSVLLAQRPQDSGQLDLSAG